MLKICILFVYLDNIYKVLFFFLFIIFTSSYLLLFVNKIRHIRKVGKSAVNNRNNVRFRYFRFVFNSLRTMKSIENHKNQNNGAIIRNYYESSSFIIKKKKNRLRSINSIPLKVFE